MLDTLVEVAENVWIFPHNEDPNRVQPNVGIVVTRNHTVLIDAGNSPRHGRRILIALDDIRAPAVSHIIYTHSHWDHVFGAQLFGATVIAHELCRKQLAELASRPWSNTYIQEEIQRIPSREPGLRAMQRAMEDWRNFRLVLPEIVLSKSLTLYLDDVAFEIQHVGGLHAPDSLVVRIPQRKSLFLGDCYYAPPLALHRPDDSLNQPMIRSLIDRHIDVYIDGHSEPMTRRAFQRLA
jgi:glyoxylase-like metal-dependent hydrolase (beta-lactamase superfamily II)